MLLATLLVILVLVLLISVPTSVLLLGLSLGLLLVIVAGETGTLRLLLIAELIVVCIVGSITPPLSDLRVTVTHRGRFVSLPS